MNPIIQEDQTGCGLATVATLAKVSYLQVKRVAGQLGIDVQDPLLWSDITYIRRLLAHYNMSSSSHTTPFKSWDRLPSIALLAIKWHQRNTLAFWHWALFVKRPDGPVVLDPKNSLKKNVRTDFGRIKPKWFLKVTVPSNTQKLSH